MRLKTVGYTQQHAGMLTRLLEVFCFTICLETLLSSEVLSGSVRADVHVYKECLFVLGGEYREVSSFQQKAMPNSVYTFNLTVLHLYLTCFVST